MNRRVVFYVSGHGFGHSTRIQAVINHLPPERADVTVRTTAPEWLYRQNVSRPFDFTRVECDVGVVQADSLTTRPAETLDRWLAFEAQMPGWVRAEAEFLNSWGADLIVADIPSAAFEASSRAGIRSVAMTNFSWDWIYRNYIHGVPDFEATADRIAASYAKCDLLFRLPFYGDLSAFPRVEDVPLVAPEGRREPGDVRKDLGVSLHEPLVCVSFGGFEFDRFPWAEAEQRAPGLRFVAMARMERPPAGNVIVVPPGTMPHFDLVRASDLVISKPGYGIVAECIAGRTPLLYTSRGDFAEYPILVNGMSRHLPTRFVAPEEIPSGDVIDAAAGFLETISWDGLEPIGTDGARVVADRLLSLMGS